MTLSRSYDGVGHVLHVVNLVAGTWDNALLLHMLSLTYIDMYPYVLVPCLTLQLNERKKKKENKFALFLMHLNFFSPMGVCSR